MAQGLEMDEDVRRWVELSDYDLETAEAMLQTREFLKWLKKALK